MGQVCPLNSMHYAICINLGAYLPPKLRPCQIQCSMRFMHCYLMQYEIVDCSIKCKTKQSCPAEHSQCNSANCIRIKTQVARLYPTSYTHLISYNHNIICIQNICTTLINNLLLVKPPHTCQRHRQNTDSALDIGSSGSIKIVLFNNIT